MTVQLYCGDCLDVLPKLGPEHSFDLICADLPYGTTACKWDTVIPFAPLWAEYKRLIKPRGAIVLFGSQPFTSLLVASNLEWFKYSWVWNKRNAANFLAAKKMPLIINEDICVFSPAGANNGATVAMTYNPVMEKRDKPRTGTLNGDYQRKNPKYNHINHRDMPAVTWDARYPVSIIDISNADRTNKVHPTQKPVALLEYLIRTYTNEGETVLDNTMGSGTCGVACVNTGRSFVGIEKNAGYYAIAQRRITEAQQQLPLLVWE